MVQFYYRCDSRFHLDTLSRLYEECAEWIGIVLASGNEARFYRVSANAVEITLLERMQVTLPKRQGRGGQSKLRFERLTEEKRDVYVKRLAESVVKWYTDKGVATARALVLAGPGEIKQKLRQQPLVQQYFGKTKNDDSLSVINTAEISDQTISIVLRSCTDLLMRTVSSEERKAVEAFEDIMLNDADQLVFGREEVLAQLGVNGGGLRTLLVAKADDTVDVANVLDLLAHHPKTTLCRTGSEFVEKYGVYAGVKWF